MWDLPRPGLEPVSPALAGRFSTTAPPGKPRKSEFFVFLSFVFFLSEVYEKFHVFLLNSVALNMLSDFSYSSLCKSSVDSDLDSDLSLPSPYLPELLCLIVPH